MVDEGSAPAMDVDEECFVPTIELAASSWDKHCGWRTQLFL